MALDVADNSLIVLGRWTPRGLLEEAIGRTTLLVEREIREDPAELQRHVEQFRRQAQAVGRTHKPTSGIRDRGS